MNAKQVNEAHGSRDDSWGVSLPFFGRAHARACCVVIPVALSLFGIDAESQMPSSWAYAQERCSMYVSSAMPLLGGQF